MSDINTPKMVLVPQSQIDKVEAVRLALHEINAQEGGSKYAIRSLALQSQCSILWEIANRKYPEIS